MQSSHIRQMFLDFFVAHGHREVPSSSLVPADDPTLLFTNAGMVQFKRVFQGQESRDYLRATTVQKCVRAGGKHNDLEQVGLTRRHHTFFEMLGNFSFGDYFKRDAIKYAWEFVTSATYLGLHPDRIRVTVHETDDEARALWREIAGLPDHRIYSLGDKDNFWQMGDTGPCGPCSEIFVDLEWEAGKRGTGEVIDQENFERQAESGRFLEIWNLVFMQFDRSADGTLTPLPKPSVDTGAGFERIAAVMQGEDDNFHTDLFLPLFQEAERLVGKRYGRTAKGEDVSFRVLADHARAVSFLLADGVYPSNEGRGYVLRRILRRGVRHAWLLGRREPTLTAITGAVVRAMGSAYPELQSKAEYIARVTRTEEERFLETIDGGLKRLDEIVASGTRQISGEDAFKLYDTFGFPIDLTEIIAGEKSLAVDLPGFDAALEEQRKRSRAARKGGGEAAAIHVGNTGEWQTLRKEPQRFVGYQTTAAATEILAFRQDGTRVDIVLRENPFYVESGGQVSDTGMVTGPDWALQVDTVRKDPLGTVLSGAFAERFEPTPLEALVDAPRRRNIERNHSATHIVHAALRRVLGTHVRQQGSLVEPERLRFDFSHHGPIDLATLQTIEREVNEQVLENADVVTREMPYPEALKLGAMAFFSEKYGDVVRVVQMGDSIELCGGTHVRTTGQIGLFRVLGQGGVAAGVRRIEAITGEGAYRAVIDLQDRVRRIAETLKSQPDQLLRRTEQLLEEKTKLEARLAEALKGSSGQPSGGDKFEVNGIAVTVGETQLENRDEVAAVADSFRGGKSSAVLVLLSGAGRGAVHVAVTDDLVKAGRKAGDLVSRIAAVGGGKGGGRPQFASAGIGDAAKLPAARAAVPSIVAEWLGAQ